jgi:preprotein translocase subunit YajC
MHIKFLPHGTGSPQRAVAYLLAVHDHNGIQRPEVRVLRGNPKLVADLAETLSFVHRYTSGVISWHADDDPSSEEVQEVLDDFERLAFAGLEPDQYSSAAIWHRGHVHVIAARVELRTGLSHNLAPPGRQKAFDHLRNYWNHKKGWARPDDPNRARQVQPGRMIKANLAAIKLVEADELLTAFGAEPELQGREQRKAAVVEWIRGRILANAINSRDDVITSLGQVGTVNRVGKDYLSVRIAEDDKPIRLKGSMFDERFDADAIRAAEMTPSHVVRLGKAQPDLEAAATSKAKLEEAIKRRTIYNHGRYKLPKPSPISVDMLRPVPTASDEEVSITVEENDDRTRNTVIAEVVRAFEVSRIAIQRLARAVRFAGRHLAALDRAIGSFERGSRHLARLRRALRSRTEDASCQPIGVKKSIPE